MRNHHLEPGPETCHGSFSRDLAPVLTIDPGDTISFGTLDGDWLVESLPGPPPRHGAAVAWRRPGLDDGHALIGPVAVAGARPGSTVRVRFLEIVPASWGWSRVGGRPVEHDRRLGIDGGEAHYLRWDLDPVTGLATSNEGHRVRMRPFLGVVGVAPEESGRLSTHPPRRSGGNIDFKDLVVGTDLYLPVAVDDALVSFGDGHAVQGDGESGATAVECPMERVRVQVDLIAGLALDGPRARTHEGWVTFGFAPSLDDAAFDALSEMGDLLAERLGCGRKEAMNLAGQVVDLRVTQIVNGVKGVHAVVSHDALAMLAGR